MQELPQNPIISEFDPYLLIPLGGKKGKPRKNTDWKKNNTPGLCYGSAPFQIFSGKIEANFLRARNLRENGFWICHLHVIILQRERHFPKLHKITVYGDRSHKIKRHLLLGRKAMTNLERIIKSRDIILPTKVSQSYGFSSGHVWMWELGHKESWVPKNWCFWTVVLEKTLESLLNCKEIKPANPKWNQSWIFIGRTDAEAETPILWPLDVKNWLIGKDPDARKDWKQEEKGTTEDEMVGWHHQLYAHEFEQALGVGDGQGDHGVTKSWTWPSDWTELNWSFTSLRQNYEADKGYFWRLSFVILLPSDNIGPLVLRALYCPFVFHAVGAGHSEKRWTKWKMVYSPSNVYAHHYVFKKKNSTK